MEYNVTFGSQIKPSRTIRQAFNIIQSNKIGYENFECTHRLAKNLETILADGKNDVIELTKSNGFFKDITVKVNQKPVYTDYSLKRNPTGSELLASINRALTSFIKQRDPSFNVDDLTCDEKEKTAAITNEIAQLTNDRSAMFNFFCSSKKYWDLKEKFANIIFDINKAKLLKDLQPKILNDKK